MPARTHTTVRDLERDERRQEKRRAQSEASEVPPYWRPKTRADCLTMPRPCPFYGCRYHLGLDVTPAGSIRMPYGEDLMTMKETCALDVADRGAQNLEDLGDITNYNKERIRQVMLQAFDRLVENLGAGEDIAETKRESLRRSWTKHAILDEPE